MAEQPVACWTASLFLAGPAVSQRRLLPRAVSGVNSLSPPSLQLRYLPNFSGGFEGHANTEKVSPECLPRANWLGVADGGVHQPLLVQTSTPRPVVWVGDADSLSSKPPARSEDEAGPVDPRMNVKNLILDNCPAAARSLLESQGLQPRLLPTAKDQSDGACLLDALADHLQNQCRREGAESVSNHAIEVVGAWGGRPDHVRSNQLELLRFLRQSAVSSTALVAQPWGVLLRGRLSIAGVPKGTSVSVFGWNVDESSQSVTLKGCLHSGEIVLQRPSHGLSNQALGGCIDVDTGSGIVELIISKESEEKSPDLNG